MRINYCSNTVVFWLLMGDLCVQKMYILYRTEPYKCTKAICCGYMILIIFPHCQRQIELLSFEEK